MGKQVEDPSRDELLARGRRDFADAQWKQAFEALKLAERTAGLEAPDLEMLATAAYLIGEDAETASAWSRAHDAWLSVDDEPRAARCAFWAGWGLFYRGQGAQAQGWFATAHALVADLQDSVEWGLLLIPEARTILDGDTQSAARMFEQARKLGEDHHEPSLTALGLLGSGQASIRTGQVDEGVALLDRAMVTAMSAGAMPLIAGTVYCAVLLECDLLFDIARAREWTGVLQEWCTPEMAPFRGQCLVHRSELMQLDGLWPAAMEEARLACELLSGPPAQPAVGMAHYQRAELHRLRGSHDEALEAYQTANEFGHPPQPGLALLRLAQGKLDMADSAIRRAVADAINPLRRAALLAAYVDILLTNGDVSGAREGAAELTAMAQERQVPLLSARAAAARGVVQLADGDPAEALASFALAQDAWREIGSTFEIARIRVVVGLAERALGDEDAARAEFQAADRVFRRVGAEPELRRVRHLLGQGRGAERILSPRELEVLQEVALGRTNRQIATTLVISDKTVERHLSNLYRKLGVRNRTGATKYWYEHHA